MQEGGRRGVERGRLTDVSLEAMLADDGSARGQSVCSSVSLSLASDAGASSRPLSAVPLSEDLFTAGFPPSLHSIPCSMYSCLRLCSLSHTLCIDIVFVVSAFLVPLVCYRSSFSSLSHVHMHTHKHSLHVHDVSVCVCLWRTIVCVAAFRYTFLWRTVACVADMILMCLRDVICMCLSVLYCRRLLLHIA